MYNARLYLEGSSTLWVIVRCSYCHEFNKYVAIDTFRKAVECNTCGHLLTIQKALRVEAATRRDIPGDLRSQLDFSDPLSIA